MDRLWSPWRFTYISKAAPSDACIFCAKSAERRDRENFIVFRGERNFVLLNLYPYTNGHLMIAESGIGRIIEGRDNHDAIGDGDVIVQGHVMA